METCKRAWRLRGVVLGRLLFEAPAVGRSKLSRVRAPAPVWFQPSTQLRSFPVSCFGMHSRSLHESAPVLFQQRKSQPPLSLRKRRKAQAERWVEADDDDNLEVDYETAVDREEVAPRQMPVVISNVPAACSESRTTSQKREDEISRMEESLRALMSEQENRSEEETQFLRDKENEWREWQKQKRQKRAATMQGIDEEEIELEFSRSEANFDIGVVEDEELQEQQQQQKQQKLAKSQVERWAHAEPADEGVVNFKSNAKDRKQERRMLVIAKAVRVHLRAALGSGRATKRRDDLAFLSTSVFITQVIMSKDVGHAEVLWTPMNAGSADELKTEVDRIEKALDAIKGALRNVLAVELNIRRCPEITLRVDPAWLASVRAEAAFEKMKEQRAMWAAAGYRREEEGDAAQRPPAHAPVHAAPPAAAAKEKHFSQDEIEYMEAVLASADTDADADAAAEADDDAHGRRFVSFISVLVLKYLACWY
jgi:ribosome-binding factor A